MFGIDDFALWFSWYFVSNLAQQHPAAQRLVEKAESAISDTNTGIRVEDPDLLLDWLDRSAVNPAQQPRPSDPAGGGVSPALPAPLTRSAPPKPEQ